jgi:hypothetical protein
MTMSTFENGKIIRKHDYGQSCICKTAGDPDPEIYTG